ncbi:radical SAM protein [Candidatus Shapirobacteria bacterium]|nr:radical SAM protein [Candidatus Shapirobacteria bacterium]
MLLKINEITAKTILTKSGLPGADWVVNSYGGCQLGCTYCYAAQIARWHHPDEEWGSYLDVKTNAPELLKNELNKLSRRDARPGVSTHQNKIKSSKDFGFIFFSSVTDPYTGLEAKYHITRQCLQVFVDFGYEGAIGIQTKSPLVTQDIDILKKLKKVQVGFTVTTLDDQVARFLEPLAPPISARIEALKQLHDNGVSTYAFVGPILPHFVNNKKAINELLDALQHAGVSEVWFEHLNQSSKIKTRLYEYLQKNSPELIPDFESADTAEYRDNLNKIILDSMKNRPMTLALGKVIFHHDLPKKR